MATLKRVRDNSKDESNETELNQLIKRTAKIAYEKQIVAAFIFDEGNFSVKHFENKHLNLNDASYTIIDVRNYSEVKANKLFANSIHIPLDELRERTNEIPTNKPILVHCAGGYRSAAGSSILQAKFGNTLEVFDLSESVKEFQL